MTRHVTPPHRDYAMTLSEVAAVIGVSRVRAHIIEKNALKKIRKALKARNLSFDDLCVHAIAENAFVGHENYERL